MKKIMQRNIKFKKTVSNEYKDLVNSLLQIDQSKRIPLIKVFSHPWVIAFQVKYNLGKEDFQATPSGSREESKAEEQTCVQHMGESDMVKTIISDLHELTGLEEGKDEYEGIQQMLMRRKNNLKYDSRLEKREEDGEEDIYGMCDQLLEEIQELDDTLNQAPASGHKSKQEQEQEGKLDESQSLVGKFNSGLEEVERSVVEPAEPTPSSFGRTKAGALVKQDYSLASPLEESKEVDFSRMRRNYAKNFE